MSNKNELTIRLSGKEGFLPAKSFLKTVDRTINLLSSVGENIYQGEKPLEWRIIRVSMDSPLEITMDAGDDVDLKTTSHIISACVDGIRKLEHENQAPEYFDDKAMRHAKKLVESLNNGLSNIELIFDNLEGIKPTRRLASNIDSVRKTARQTHFTWTTIEGMLDFANVHGKYEFKVFDIMTDQAVKCVVPGELFDKAKESLGKRVYVTGEARLDSSYALKSMQVEKIEAIRPDHELPRIEDLKEVNVTGGLSAEEYLERLHDGEEI